ncbi:DNA phosphorothioation-associated protein 4 [Sphaerospermopsis torques-reginae]|jgi:dnd system-associated protein 4|uniref:DNA phosphorothioation-associated protein 4 n=1 Tax=Sphaerospermopsis torques-reginae ITEP-024 TaxID=984208 RepID=A0ABX8WUK7_9CYAN|nr:DNA phosphorothioation-associated protein 4 [Sphaerospermopsis torques-reginae]QYX30109.1 DNA phosphorothioation-associated protein 4 [Sphaerospermopsis torques-reginae ITEP-024]
MAESGRIRVAKDKADLVKSLISSDGGNGPFQTFADVIVFAAALGVKYKKRVPFEEVSKREPVPIRIETFMSMGYDVVIKLLGITETQNIQILSPSDEEFEKQRNEIFEEYANGGLEVLQEHLRGAIDYTDQILLFLISDKDKKNEDDGEFDLRKFLS